jgi:hypothetical protein
MFQNFYILLNIQFFYIFKFNKISFNTELNKFKIVMDFLFHQLIFTY